MQRIKPILFAVPVALAALGATALFSDEHDKKTDVTLSEPVRVPGGVVLQPGTYMFILANTSDSRNIVEIKSDDGKQLYAMIFATRAARVERTGKTVLTFYEMPQGEPMALRQWFWPGDYDGQEFLYPHNEAVKIDQATNQTVPETTDQDYAKLNNSGFSTNHPGTSSTQPSSSTQSSAAVLNSDDQAQSQTQSAAAISQATTETTVSDSSQQAVVNQPAPSDQVESTQTQSSQAVAQVNAEPAPAPQTSNETLAQNDPPNNLTPPTSQDAAGVSNSDQALPQTASPFPSVGLAGLLLLTAGAMLRFARQGA
jgi:hypothetical protein